MSTRTRVEELGARLSGVWARYMSSGGDGDDTPSISATALQRAPVVWLLGKVQAGKTSIVQAITDCSDAEIGSGFQAATRTSRVFDYPTEAPLIRFLDTRGLGEAGYDPADDLAACMGKAHLLVVVVRALDHQIDELAAVVADIRRRHPDWPVVVAQTCLHESYSPEEGHILPYPFDGDADAQSSIPDHLRRSLARQRAALTDIAGTGPLSFVPIDFTQPDDGIAPRLYGLEPLLAAIGQAAPASIVATLRQLHATGTDRVARHAHPRILGHASVAAAADAVPVAGAIAVPGVQAKLLHTLGRIYGVPWDRRTLTEFATCLGGGIILRMLAGYGIRQLVKLIPVYGQTAGSAAAAATSFATTYALGKAAGAFLSRRKLGEHDAAAVVGIYREALESAFKLARDRNLEASVGKEQPDAPR